MLHVIHGNGSTVPGAPHNWLTNGIDYLLVLGGLLYCLAAARAPKEQGSEPLQLLLWIKETKSNNGEHNSTLHEEENITQRYMNPTCCHKIAIHPLHGHQKHLRYMSSHLGYITSQETLNYRKR
jgi:hypothetical protein